MTEIKKVKAEIKMLEKKLSFLEELEKTKTPCEEAFKEFYGAYPITDIADTSWDSDGWIYFEAGYNAAYEENVSETPQTPEQVNTFAPKELEELVRESVKWCEENTDKDPLDWLKPQTPEQVADGLKEAFREAVKQGVVSSSTKPQNLYDLIADCMVNYNSTVHPELICDILDALECWLPDDDPHDGKEYQYRVGWNACLKFMRANLR